MNSIPLSQLDQENQGKNKPIWGLNTLDTSELAQDLIGEIIIAIPFDKGNGADILKMPQTWLPQELTKVITRKRLLGATQFRRAVNDGLISIISQEEAERLMRQSGANQEKERLLQAQRHVKTAGGPRTIADSGASIARADGLIDDDEDTNRNKTYVIKDDKTVAQLASSGVEDDEPGIKPSFKMWAERLNLMADDMEVKNAIKGRRKFIPEEMRFLQRVVDRKYKETHKLIAKNIK